MKMPTWIKLTPHTMHVEVRELWVDGRFYLRDVFINFAKKTKREIIFHYKGEKYCYFKATDWMKGSKRMEKEEKIPGVPMIRFGNFLGEHKIEKSKQPEEVSAIKNLAGLSEIQRNQVKVKLGLI